MISDTNLPETLLGCDTVPGLAGCLPPTLTESELVRVMLAVGEYIEAHPAGNGIVAIVPPGRLILVAAQFCQGAAISWVISGPYPDGDSLHAERNRLLTECAGGARLTLVPRSEPPVH